MAAKGSFAPQYYRQNMTIRYGSTDTTALCPRADVSSFTNIEGGMTTQCHFHERSSLRSMTKNTRNRFFNRHKTQFFLSIYVIAYVSFLVVGAIIFIMLEESSERAIRAQVDASIQNFLDAHPNVADEDLEALLDEVLQASNRGVTVIRNVTNEPNWSFGQAIFFTATVVTTIGYGHVTPLSRGGKLFCIVYALLGIPMTLVLLSAFVQRLLKPTIQALQWLNYKLGHLYQPLHIRILHLLIMVVILLLVFIFLPAFVFASLEPNWDYLDGIYYCFISLTTIGLGDYIPGDAPNQAYRPLYKTLTALYLLIGIAFVMLILAVFYEIPQLNFGQLFSDTNDHKPMNEKNHFAHTHTGSDYGGANQTTAVVKVRSRPPDDDDDEEDDA